MIEEIIEEGKELHRSVKWIEHRLHGKPDGYDDGRDANFASHLDVVQKMVEERVENHDAATEEGAILRSMELCLATHGIFDAAVASALVPLCADISPELSECLQRFRVKQAELVSELSRCTTRMNDLRKQAVEEKAVIISSTPSSPSVRLSLEVPESLEEPGPESEPSQSLESVASSSRSPGMSSSRRSRSPRSVDSPGVRRDTLSSKRDPDPAISPGRHYDGEHSPRKHLSRNSSPSPTGRASSSGRGLTSPTSPSRKGWNPSIFKQRSTIPSPKPVVVSDSSSGYKGTMKIRGSRSGMLDVDDPSIRSSRIYNNLLTTFSVVDEEEAETEPKLQQQYEKRSGSPGREKPDDSDEASKLKAFRSALKSAYTMKKVSAKRLGLRDVLNTLDKLVQTKKALDEKVRARASEARRDADTVEQLKLSMAANEASGQHSKLSAQQQLKLTNHENDPSAVRVPRVETMEAHLYKYFEKRYGVTALAAEHAAIFMRSLEHYAVPAEPHRDPKAKQGGLSHDRKHISRSGDGMCRTFLGILCNEIDEAFYDKQKDRQEKIHELLRADIRRESPNLSAPQAQTRLQTKLSGWMAEVEYLYFVNALFGEDELFYDEDEEDMMMDFPRHEPSFSRGLSGAGIASADALDRSKQRRQGLAVGAGHEVEDAVALYDGQAATRNRGGRVTAPLMLLLKKLAVEEREREVEAATISKVVDKSNGSLGNRATMAYLTYHSTVMSSPVKKMRKSQMVHDAWDDDNKGSKVRTADFIDTVLIYQLMAYTEYLLPLRQAFIARDHLNLGALPNRDIVRVFYEDLQHRDYHVLPSKFAASNVSGTLGNLRAGSSEALMIKKSHDTARQRTLNDLLRRILAAADPHQSGGSCFSELVRGFLLL